MSGDHERLVPVVYIESLPDIRKIPYMLVLHSGELRMISKFRVREPE